MTRLRFCTLIVGLIGCLALAGCGGPTGSNVSVTVVSPKMKLEETDNIAVTFTPDGSGEPATATGSFKELPLVASRSNKPGVIPGKYKLTVVITPYAGMAKADRVQYIKDFNKGFDASASKLTYEVTADPNQSITIDLGANTVTKK